MHNGHRDLSSHREFRGYYLKQGFVLEHRQAVAINGREFVQATWSKRYSVNGALRQMYARQAD
jgi:hypothetical protein